MKQISSVKLDKKPCRWFAEYKAIFPPKCNCQPCADKWKRAKKAGRA